MCRAVLDALNNNIILVGDDVGEGCPAESSHRIAVKALYMLCCTVVMDSCNKKSHRLTT